MNWNDKEFIENQEKVIKFRGEIIIEQKKIIEDLENTVIAQHEEIIKLKNKNNV